MRAVLLTGGTVAWSRRIGLDGTISTVAGNGTEGFSGDSGPATRAQLCKPSGFAVSLDGGFLIADRGCCARRAKLVVPATVGRRAKISRVLTA